MASEPRSLHQAAFRGSSRPVYLLLRSLGLLILLAAILGAIYWQVSQTYSFHWLLALNFISDFNHGLLLTLKASGIAAILALLLGLIVALARLSPVTQVRDLGMLYVHAFRNIPFYVFVLLAYFGAGRAIDVGPIVRELGAIIDERLFWGVLALSIFEGAFIAEIIRAGIQSIHPTQMESARSLGMTYSQAMRFIILPQAFRNIIPPLTGELIALVKESSLLFVISLPELTLTASRLASQQGSTFEFYILLAVYYLMITLPLAGLSHFMERRFAVGDQDRGRA